jgi:pimeloyl-ACP methyl ester carboxylesterase
MLPVTVEPRRIASGGSLRPTLTWKVRVTGSACGDTSRTRPVAVTVGSEPSVTVTSGSTGVAASISRRYQPWLFLYNSGNPIGYSAGVLAATLRQVVAQLDPEARDPALQRMVVVGHSQGGLLAKLMAVESGDAFWRNISSRPIDELGLQPESREVLLRSLFFEPLPFVERVVFMATPHRGTQLVEWRLVSWISRLVKLPASLTKLMVDLAAHGGDELYLSALDRPPTSLDNMAASNGFLRTLSGLPVAPGVGTNSIIAVRGSGPTREGSDGVVRFASAHLEGVDSEKVVQPSGHSVQLHQEAIHELRRILREHAAAGAAPEPRRGRGSAS